MESLVLICAIRATNAQIHLKSYVSRKELTYNFQPAGVNLLYFALDLRDLADRLLDLLSWVCNLGNLLSGSQVKGHWAGWVQAGRSEHTLDLRRHSCSSPRTSPDRGLSRSRHKGERATCMISSNP